MNAWSLNVSFDQDSGLGFLRLEVAFVEAGSFVEVVADDGALHVLTIGV